MCIVGFSISSDVRRTFEISRNYGHMNCPVLYAKRLTKINILDILTSIYIYTNGAWGSVVVKAQRY